LSIVRIQHYSGLQRRAHPNNAKEGTLFEVFTAQPQADDGTNPSRLTTIADETSALQIATLRYRADSGASFRATLVKP
jgi:hypothetical protein